MDLDKIRELLKVVAESDVAEVTIEEDDFKVTVRKDAAEISMQPSSYYPAPMPMPYGGPPHQGAQGGSAPPQGGAPPPQAGAGRGGRGGGRPAGAAGAEAGEEEQEEGSEEGEYVRAPLVGTFYRRPNPDEEPFVSVGSTVEPGQTLCIIEAMKIMNEIESEEGGTIREVLVEDGEPVEYDQPLFVIEST